MPRTVRPSPTNRPGRGSSPTAQRRAAAERAAAERRRPERRRRRITGAVVAGLGLVLVAAAVLLAMRDTNRPALAGAPASGAPGVGGDLHTIATVGDALYVGGHAAVAVSHDDGRRWQRVPSLDGADAMGWAVTTDAILAGGHPGLYRSTDGGATFTAGTGAAAVPDVHALGGAGTTVYLASPQAGLLVSTDGGQTWQVRNRQVGRSFMGTMLVDPADTKRVVAPDMSGGIMASTDGGRTWTSLGGPAGAMAVTWKPTETNEIIAVGMSGAARSADGGATWQPIDLPPGTSAVTYDSRGRTLYAGALDDNTARTYRSRDDGATWQPTG